MSAGHGSGGGIKSGFHLPFFSEIGSLQHRIDGVHPNYKQIVIVFVVVNILFFIFAPQQAITNYGFAFYLSPIYLPIFLYLSVHDRFGQLTHAKFFARQEYVLLDILVPREVTKTPAAMEAFFSSLHIGSGETTWYKRYFQGGTRPWWSLEIVSLGGHIHLYIWTRVGYRRLVEGFLYAQYPDIEIIEAEDYSRLVDPSTHGYGMFGAEYEFRNPDPHPLKTYIDYKMEPGDKPEESVDPLSQLIETIANIGPNEQFWVQIIVRMSKAEKYKGLVTAEGKQYTWNDKVKEAVEEIRSKTVRVTKKVDAVTGAVTETESFPNPSKGQSEGIANIERKASKQIFDVGIRTIYFAPNESFQGIMIPGLINLFKAFNNESSGNSLRMNPNKWTALFNDFPWEDRSGRLKHHLHQEFVQVYRKRAYFYDPFIGPWLNMSSEELATLFHIPSASVTTPNLPRIQSATSNAPSNIPS